MDRKETWALRSSLNDDIRRMHHACPFCTTISLNAPRFRALHQASLQNAPRKWEMHQAFSEMHQVKRENAPSLSHSIKIVVLSQSYSGGSNKEEFSCLSSCAGRMLGTFCFSKLSYEHLPKRKTLVFLEFCVYIVSGESTFLQSRSPECAR